MSRAAAAGTLLAAALCVVPALPAAAEGERYQIATTASAMAFKTTQDPAFSIVTDDLIDSTVAMVNGSVTSSGGSAQGAAFYPGLLIAQAPQLICQQFFPCPFEPPHYPLLSEATYPTTASASAPPAGRLATALATVDALQSSASATGDSAVSQSAVGGASLLGGLVRIGAASSSSASHVGLGTASATVESHVSDIDVGALHIGALESRDVISVDAKGGVHSAPVSTLTGVTFAGQPASIDSDGVHLLGSTVSVPNTVLDAAGLSVHLLDATLERGGVIRSSAAGLLIAARLAVTGAPQLPNVPTLNRTYLVAASIGGVGVAISAADSSITIPSSPPISSLPPSVFPSQPVPSATSPSSGPTFASEQPPAPSGGSTSSSYVLNVDHLDLKALMLALLIGALTLLLGWRAIAWFVWRRRTQA